MTRKQYKPGQFFWIKGRQYRIARVERHVQDPCDFCDLSDVCNPSMMNWCADLMPTHYYFKKCQIMCLYTKQICPLRARKDIVCYKRFEITYTINGFNTMRTAVRGTLVSIPKPNKPTVMVAYPENCIEKLRTIDPIRDRDNATFRIYGGMIHAYTKLEYSRSPWYLAIFKCIIPKGTLYYKGTSGDICAKKMLVIEQVE